jgi:YidC/Oxa1 family membrane protein insertase
MLETIINIIIWVMDKTHYVTHMWALDIILLTVLVRYLLFPLNRTMNRSMKTMQKLQPEMKEIQAKYKDKPDIAQKEVMELYKRYKVNPFSSCWPIMVQMPIFIALFWALRDPRFYLRLTGFGHATFFGTSLTIPPLFTHPYPEFALKAGMFDLYGLMHLPFLADRFFYLPTLWLLVLYIATTIIQSKQMQAQSQGTGSGQMNQMAMMLPMYIILGVLFPTGLLVYMITSNALQIGQYLNIHRELVAEEAARAEGDLIGLSPGTLSNKTDVPLIGKGSKTANKRPPKKGLNKK